MQLDRAVLGFGERMLRGFTEQLLIDALHAEYIQVGESVWVDCGRTPFLC